MRLVSYEYNGQAGVGVMAGDDGIVELSTAAPGMPGSLREILESVDGWFDKIAAAVDGKAPDRILAEVELLPVIPEPQATWCVALNYQTHKDETGLDRSAYPEMFLRMPISVVGHGQSLVRPRESMAERYDFEGELAAVIGKPGRYIPESEAFEYIAGYSCYNEGSVRDYQSHNRQFGLGKTFEKSGSFGPWMMTQDEFGDPYQQSIITRLNGKEKQNSSINLILTRIEGIIAYLSEGYTLQPGDVVVTGTPGSIPGTTKRMEPGDVCEVEITGLGTLSNPIIAAE
ncbi:MAG: fumarylacetoacetate hydrolase family protein [Rhodospirillales bacterium]|nr:fumarylacetoacetate hydrolase family protein [Rhodospirillales bacterium]MDP6643369.1 fumarylacetoacetate hydrolase family protein [Rhodospirillales bacterium]MDP6840617.1 fumarylacetoacetate hydrolase family protein [Rhodospirillales bacterium]